MIIHCRWLKTGYRDSQHLNVSNLLDSLTVAGNLMQMVGAEKLKKPLLKLVVHCKKGKFITANHTVTQ